MAGRGPAPSTTASRDRDAARRHGARHSVSSDGKTRGPELPSEVDWHPQTIKWWQTWRTSPLSQAWIDTDWDFLLDTALMHNEMWARGKWEFAAELRLRVAKLGATVEDRQRLRISVETGPKQETGNAKIMSIYKDAAS